MPETKTGRFKLVAKNAETAAMGAAFRKARKGKKMSLKKLEIALGRSLWSIRQHEAGEIMLRLDEVKRAAGLFGVTVAELAGESVDGRKKGRGRRVGASGAGVSGVDS